MDESANTAAPPPEVVQAFASAAITALQELARVDAAVENSSTLAAVDMSHVVSAAIRLLRPSAGKLTVVLTVDTASRLAARYLPQETLLTAEIVDDLAGELANVIAGQAKTMLKGTAYHFKMSPPLVVRDASVSRLSGLTATMFIASLTSEAGRLMLFVDLPPCPGA